jgi:hypothetical protein
MHREGRGNLTDYLALCLRVRGEAFALSDGDELLMWLSLFACKL